MKTQEYCHATPTPTHTSSASKIFLKNVSVRHFVAFVLSRSISTDRTPSESSDGPNLCPVVDDSEVSVHVCVFVCTCVWCVCVHVCGAFVCIMCVVCCMLCVCVRACVCVCVCGVHMCHK